MWLEVNKYDEIIYHLEEGELLPDNIDMIDGVVVHAEELVYGDQTGILLTLNSITNKRLSVELETCVPWKELTPIVKHYIDSYYNVNTNEHKQKSEVWADVLSE